MQHRLSQPHISASHGFTMLELLVTSAIVMIITGITLAGYLSFQARQEVQQATREVQQLFVQARQRARDRDQTSCADAGSGYYPVLEYNIKLQNPTGGEPASVLLFATCEGASGTFFGTEEDNPLPSSVSFESLDFDTVSFATLEGGVTILDGGSTPGCAGTFCTVKLSRDSGAHGYQFTIASTGEIGGVIPSAD